MHKYMELKNGAMLRRVENNQNAMKYDIIKCNGMIKNTI